MLAILGFVMIAIFMYLIMSNRLSALIALILIPLLTAIVSGFGGDVGKMMMDGIKSIAPTGVMLIFGILYFGIMIDTGLFDPLVSKTLKVVKGDPLKIVIGTALLALFVSLDGDGTTTFMIVVAALFPLYRQLGMNPLILTCVSIMASGVMNMLPWGGPTARVLSALHLDSSQVFVPLIPGMIVTALWVIFVAYVLGKKERKRLGHIKLPENLDQVGHERETAASAEAVSRIRRPKLLWFNMILTVALMISLITDLLPLTVLFVIGFAVALLVNYPNMADQKERISTHAGNALSVASMVFGAGIFTGILTGTGMVNAMADALVHVIPQSWGPHFPVITAITSVPFTFFMSNDAYYFGILPLLNEAAHVYGISSIEMGRASLIGQQVHLLSPLVPSTYLLVGMAGVNFGDHQKFTLKWALGSMVVMLITSLVIGVISL
ncbi:TRAP transporter large permease subunit [Brevibacillus fluminis]|uniref:TRAP transporter large permease subunit n=1 Tax=Brevibacillus fluminis TaxID=511487 RepID=A0A3M8DR13_9BACL|nr:TRAP transporter large permease subunit [Brevibacillus fluminis]